MALTANKKILEEVLIEVWGNNNYADHSDYFINDFKYVSPYALIKNNMDLMENILDWKNAFVCNDAGKLTFFNKNEFYYHNNIIIHKFSTYFITIESNSRSI